MEAADFTVLGTYLVVVVAVGLTAARQQNRSIRKQQGGKEEGEEEEEGALSGYFLASRRMVWLPIGASFFVSNIGAEHLVGLAGSGAAMGIPVAAWEFNALILFQLMSWVYLPVYMASQVFTTPEYMSKRFGGHRLRVLLAIMSILLYVTTRISADLYTAGLFIQQAVGWNLYVSIVALVALAALLTLLGGLRAVIYTETLQMCVMVVGTLVLAGLAFEQVGGFPGLIQRFPRETVCGQQYDPWRMLRPAGDSYMPWAGFILGQTPSSIWYLCTDQVILQRALAARTLSHAQGATLFAGFLKILPLFSMVLPGMISRVLFPEEVGCSSPEACYQVCQNRAGCTNIAYSKLVLEILPTGLKGLMLAAMVASLMGSMESTLNSSSTLFTLDVWQRFRPDCTVRERLLVSRVFLLFITTVSILWIPMATTAQGGQIFIFVQEISDYIAPSIATTFTLAILCPRVSENGAFWGLVVGFAVGLVRMVLSIITTATSGQVCVDKALSHSLAKIAASGFVQIHYMYFGLVLVAVTTVVTMAVSLMTPPPHPEQLHNTIYWTVREKTGSMAVGRSKSSLEMVEGCGGDAKEEIAEKGDSKWQAAGEDGVDDTSKHERYGRRMDGSESAWREDECSSRRFGGISMGSCSLLVKQCLMGVQPPLTEGGSEGGYDGYDPLYRTPIEVAVLRAGLGVVVPLAVSSYLFWTFWDPTAAGR